MRRPFFVPTKDYLCNYWVAAIPFHKLRMGIYRSLGLHIGSGSTLLMGTRMLRAEDIRIGDHTIINPCCYLDGRGGLTIGNNVNISSHVVVVAGTHDINDATEFSGMMAPVVIEDYAWLCARCTVLSGVTIGRGSVVAAGAVVTRSTEPYSVNAGVPARKIAERRRDLSYTLSYEISWI